MFAALLLIAASHFSAQPPITAVASVPGEDAVVVGSQAGIEVRGGSELKAIRRLPTQLLHVHDLRFSPDGKTLAAVGGKPAERGEIEFFSWPIGKLDRRIHWHEDVIQAMAWHRSGSGLATASSDQSVQLQMPNATEPRRLAGHSRGVTAAVFLPGGLRLVSAGEDHSLRVWDTETGELLRTLDNHTEAVRDLAVRPSLPPDAAGESLPLVASAGADATVRFWQPTVGRLVRFARLPRRPLAIAWTPSGERCLAACEDGAVRVIDPETAAVLGHRAAVSGWAYCLAAAPDGRSVIVGGERGELRRVSLEELRILETSK